LLSLSLGTLGPDDPVPPFDLVIFGGTGDLARRKLLPAPVERKGRTWHEETESAR
jgi:glucose-6-phosphate 1-dehydrogenase